MVSTASDADLMRRLSGVEHELFALATLYDRYHQHALALAQRCCRDPARIEQAVEEAFLLVWRKADHYQPAHVTPRDWLLGIVAWRCRALSRAPEGLRPDLPFESATHGARNVG
jgi:RNA polymerase sigma-70 factor (ECF subfamily)